jgi:cytoskeletal protein CcmA (bactofilin family)
MERESMLADKAEQQGSEARREGASEGRKDEGPAGARKSGGKAPSVIGAGVTVTGNLVSAGDVEIEGEVQGDIRCKSVLIGDKARVAGEVAAEDVVVLGRVDGAIRGELVMLKTGSRVDADLYYTSLVVHQGAIFDGSSQHTSDPMSEMAAANGTERSEASRTEHRKGETQPA